MHNLDNTDLGGLEYQISSLLRTLQHVKSENNQLRQQVTHLKKEMALTEEKRQLATHQMNQLINRLKEEMA